MPKTSSVECEIAAGVPATSAKIKNTVRWRAAWIEWVLEENLHNAMSD